MKKAIAILLVFSFGFSVNLFAGGVGVSKTVGGPGEYHDSATGYISGSAVYYSLEVAADPSGNSGYYILAKVYGGSSGWVLKKQIHIVTGQTWKSTSGGFSANSGDIARVSIDVHVGTGVEGYASATASW